jgi:hypothetical protein
VRAAVCLNQRTNNLDDQVGQFRKIPARDLMVFETGFAFLTRGCLTLSRRNRFR